MDHDVQATDEPGKITITPQPIAIKKDIRNTTIGLIRPRGTNKQVTTISHKR